MPFLDGGEVTVGNVHLRPLGDFVVRGERGNILRRIPYIAEGQRILVGNAVVPAHHEIILVARLESARENLRHAAGGGEPRHRVERHRGGHAGCDAYVRQIRSSITGESRRDLAGQESIVGVIVGNGRFHGLPLLLSQTFVVHEEERFVFLDRASERSAILIPPIGRDIQGIEEVARVQIAVTQELVSRSMEAVGAGLSYGVNHGAVAAKLRRVGIGQRLKLTDGVDSQRSAERAGPCPVRHKVRNIAVIQQEGLAFGPGSGDRIGVPSPEKVAPAGGDRYNSGRQRDQLRKVPSVQRKLAHLRGFDQIPDGCRGRLHLGNLALHGDRLLRLSDLKREVHHDLRAYGKRDTGADQGRKPGIHGGHFEVSDRQLGHAVPALAVRYGALGDSGPDVLHGDRGPGNSGARRVGHRPQNGRSRSLGVHASNAKLPNKHQGKKTHYSSEVEISFHLVPFSAI